ncbi:Cytochrome P450 3A11, partial [Stegodyphus mimosarum]
MEATDFVLEPLIAIFLAGIAVIIFLYRYSTSSHSYWKKKGVPYVKPFPIFGSVLENMLKPLSEVELDRYKKYGSVYGHYEGNRAVISVADPVLLRDIFVKDFQFFTGRRPIGTGNPVSENMMPNLRGEDWKRVRTIVTPTFTTGKIKRMMSILKDCSKALVGNFRKSAEKGDPVEAKPLYGAFTMDVIASSAFSTKLDSYNDPNNKFVQTARRAFGRSVTWRFALFALWPSIMRWFKISVFSPAELAFFKDITLQIIEERKRTGQTRNDFLQLLLDTAEEVSKEETTDVSEKETGDIAENYGEVDQQHVFKEIYSNKNLSYDELVAQCVIFFLAGYETTAATLSLTTYALALNQDVQDKLRQEVDEAIKANNGELTYETIQNMKYLDNVISETLRLYSPAIRTERYADADYKLGDTGITIPKGMVITIPIFAIHRDPKYYPDPEKFNPDRFSPEERAKRDQYTYLPFGHGPRNCIGMRFALMEIKVCLAEVLRNFKIKRCPQTKVPLEFRIGNGQGLLQPKEIVVQFEIRKDKI